MYGQLVEVKYMQDYTYTVKKTVPILNTIVKYKYKKNGFKALDFSQYCLCSETFRNSSSSQHIYAGRGNYAGTNWQKH